MVKFKESESGQYVRYTGNVDVRRITKADFKAVDVDHDTVEWSQANAFHVPVEDISEDAWPYVDQDDDLKLVKVEDPSTIKAQSVSPRASTHPLAAARAAAATDAGGGTTTVASGSGSATTTGGSTAGGTAAGTGRGRTT